MNRPKGTGKPIVLLNATEEQRRKVAAGVRKHNREKRAAAVTCKRCPSTIALVDGVCAMCRRAEEFSKRRLK